MDTVLCIALLVWIVVDVLTLINSRYVAREANLSGRRAGLKKARDIARQQADVSLALAPRGRLNEGVVRSNTAFSIAEDIDAEIGILDEEE